jgi:23S rRNA (cytosine1962-C5)-methyltransferase
VPALNIRAVIRRPKAPRIPRDLAKLTPKWDEYQLLDSGGERKLERFGRVTLVRPEPQATWQPSLGQEKWKAALAEFRAGSRGQRGEWDRSKFPPPRWIMERKNLRFWVEFAPSGHLGVFPDQAVHWDWISERVQEAGRPVEVLSLFGHTGLATLSAAAAGANVTHVDASQPAMKRARENQELSTLWDRPIRWISEDAFKYVTREVRRGRRYDGIVLDPPKFGRGPSGEIWKLENSLPALLRRCREVLSATPLFVVVNTYTTVVTRDETAEDAARLNWLLREILEDFPVTKITAGELLLADSGRRKITQSVFARAEIWTESKETSGPIDGHA